MSEQGSTDSGPPDDRHVDLIAAAQRGDAASRDELLDLLTLPLHRWLERQMGSRLKRFIPVDDIAQETLARVLASLGHLHPDADLDDVRALLFRNARWTVLRRANQARRFHGESVLEQADSRDRGPAAPEHSAGAVTVADELRWMSALIDEMESDLAEVLREHLEGVSFAQLAERLGLTESAVRKRFGRALEELRRLAEARGRRNTNAI